MPLPEARMRKLTYHRQAWVRRFRLASNWRRLHRSYTVILSVLLALLSAAQDQWPLFQSFITPQRFAVVSMVLALVIAVFRYLEQPSLRVSTDVEGQTP
jgi:hypothetical protein